MIGGLSVSESAIEVLSLINYTHTSFFHGGSSVLRGSVAVIAPRRKKQKIIATRSALSDGGDAVVVDKEFDFEPSFGDYLKAMESVKTDRDNNNNTNNNNSNNSKSSSNTSRKPRIVKKNVREEEENGADVATSGRRESREGVVSNNGAFVREGSRKGDFRDDEVSFEKFKKQDKKLKAYSGKKSDSRESEFMDMERAAFKSLDYEGVIDKPRVSKVDMDERILKLAKCLNGADIDIPEWKFSEMMRSAQIRFSDHSTLRIVQILGKLGNWRRVLQVIEWIQARERYKSHRIRHVYTAALDALGKARRPVEALNLFHRMLDQMDSYPDIVAYHCIAVTLGQAGHLKELFDVIDIMRSPPKKKFKTEFLEKWDPRLEPDVIVYNSVLNACVRREKWEGAFWVLQQLGQQGQHPSSTTYGLVMEVMLACGKYNLVHDFFKKVQKSYIPNALIYKVLVNTLWKEGKTDEAIMAVEEMENRGIVGNAGLYYDLARCLCSAGRCHEALKQIDKMCKVANKPLVVTYTGLIQACLESGDVESGAYIFNHMKKFCSPNLVTCNIMLKGFLDNGMFEEAKHLFIMLLENSNSIKHEEDYKVKVIPDIYSFNTMLDACAIEKKWEDLESVYEQMLRYGHHFNGKRHLRMILDARRAGKEELLEMTWEHLVETGRDPPPLIVTEMFCVRLEQGDCAAALSYLVNFAYVESQVFSRKSWSKVLVQNAHRFEEHVLDELVREGNILLAGNENLAVRHLVESCKEFVRAKRSSTEVVVGRIFQTEAALV
ncbi:hypothetical protein ABFS83_13G184800 [Erythranthe nasuta]